MSTSHWHNSSIFIWFGYSCQIATFLSSYFFDCNIESSRFIQVKWRKRIGRGEHRNTQLQNIIQRFEDIHVTAEIKMRTNGSRVVKCFRKTRLDGCKTVNDVDMHFLYRRKFLFAWNVSNWRGCVRLNCAASDSVATSFLLMMSRGGPFIGQLSLANLI